MEKKSPQKWSSGDSRTIPGDLTLSPIMAAFD